MMQGSRTIRILATNDFFGSFAPSSTSYGALPGGAGLMRAVERLREGQPTLWADAGDFSGGPLAVLSDGVLGFQAAAELGIDVAAAGNHEFDWGLAHLQAQAARLPFPLLCANAEAGLPGTALLSAGGVDVGFIGLTMPDAELNPRFSAAPEPDVATTRPLIADRDLAAVVPAAARRLRADGATFVVALLHDGVDLGATSAGATQIDPGRLIALCRPWAADVDAIVAGHTVVGRWFGHVAGVSVVQPWAYGAEVAVIDLTPGEPARAHGVMVDAADHWTGAGSDLLQRVTGRVAGSLPAPLSWPGASPNLLDFTAAALRTATGADAAVVMAWTGGLNTMQPAIDGVQAFLPAGPVSEIELLRAVPWPDDATVRLTVTPDEWEDIVQMVGEPAARGRVGTSLHPSASRRRLTVAMTAYMAAQTAHWLGSTWEWEDTGSGLRHAIRTALQR